MAGLLYNHRMLLERGEAIGSEWNNFASLNLKALRKLQGICAFSVAPYADFEAAFRVSEFAHSNFLSSSNAFILDTITHRMIFRHQAELKQSDFQNLVFLSL